MSRTGAPYPFNGGLGDGEGIIPSRKSFCGVEAGL
jgi:hypothetical protein